jgi:fimbrial isopeptide formation D2 family protein/LPXTG-motif cell wall-anchored protein
MVSALVLAGCMVGSFNVITASAEGTSITINTPTSVTPTGTYKAYQIFKGTYTDSKLTITGWGDDVNSTTLLSALQSATGFSEDVSFSGLTTAQQVAYVVDGFDNNSADAYLFAKLVAQNVDSTKGTELTVGTASNVDVGYYIVTGGSDNTVTGGILEVVNGENTVNLKIGTPTAIKKVQENTKYGTDKNTEKDSNMSSLTLNTNDDYGWNDVADYNIGDNVPFRLYGTLPDNYDSYDTYYYQFVDTISSNLTIDADSIKVYKNSVASSNLITNTDGQTPNYVTSITNGSDNTTSLTVTFGDTKSTGITKNDIIIVEYDAKLNSSATIGLNGQENAVHLVYANNPNSTSGGWTKTTNDDDSSTTYTPTTPDTGNTGTTTDDKVIVFTYELDVTKVDGADKTTPLSGAEFVLYKEDTDNHTRSYAIVDSNNKVAGWTKVTGVSGEDGNYTYTVPTTVSANDITTATVTDTTGYTYTLTSAQTSGQFSVIGLDDDTYYLQETLAPTNYNTLDTPVKVVISATTANNQSWNMTASTALTALKSKVNSDAEVASTATNLDKVSIKVENNKGLTLPNTGGIGTTVFYLSGGVLVVGAGVTLIAKKRMKANK